MKNKLLIFISLLMLSISLVGCSSSEVEEGNYVSHYRALQIGDRTFIPLKDTSSNSGIYVDVETRVQYLYSYNMNMFTPLLDSDGKPILYEGELK